MSMENIFATHEFAQTALWESLGKSWVHWMHKRRWSGIVFPQRKKRLILVTILVAG